MWDVIVLIPDHCLSIYFKFFHRGLISYNCPLCLEFVAKGIQSCMYSQ